MFDFLISVEMFVQNINKLLSNFISRIVARDYYYMVHEKTEHPEWWIIVDELWCQFRWEYLEEQIWYQIKMLRLALFLFDSVLVNNSPLKERVWWLFPDGTWQAYHSFHRVEERYVPTYYYYCESCGKEIAFGDFCLECEAKAESMAGCS